MTAMLLAALFSQVLQPRNPPANEAPAVLAGPRVAPSQGPTLVQRDFNGGLIKLELFPAHAALRCLELDAQARAKVEAILNERTALLDSVVRDHFEMLIELFSAGQAGDQPETIRIAVAFTQKLKPLIARGAIETELAAALPQTQAQRLHALVSEYYDALLADAPAKPDGKRPARFEIVAGETLRLWGEQIRLSFERQVVGGEIFFERIIRQLDLRPDQEERLRDRIGKYVEETKLNPTKEQERQFGLEVMAWLDPAQQARLIRIFRQAEGMYKPRSKAQPENAGKADDGKRSAPAAGQ